ncbi:aminotransferase class I/II-fold pyridoxal phosphate-dependent enzyme [Silvimonas sp. JCM 19000]
MPTLNQYLQQAPAQSSKAIAQAAKANPQILNLSIGEPDFALPQQVLDAVAAEDLQLAPLLQGLKAYEHSCGALTLRRAIAAWYAQRYGLQIDPEQEILVTHGGMQALNVALLCVTNPGDEVQLSDPGYTLYDRAIHLMGRRVRRYRRAAAEHEFLDFSIAASSQAVLLNSPENPTGYVSSAADWARIQSEVARAGCWLVHDEVYDTLALSRPHQPAWAHAGLRERSLLVNSCSKKFGVPGLRIGWLIAAPEVIALAARVHESMCLSVNPWAQRIATRLLTDPGLSTWCEHNAQTLRERNLYALNALGPASGFAWNRTPRGGMFLFPEVSAIYQNLPAAYAGSDVSASDAVAKYLLQAHEIAVVPGDLYGQAGAGHIRLTNCGDGAVFQRAISRMAEIHKAIWA